MSESFPEPDPIDETLLPDEGPRLSAEPYSFALESILDELIIDPTDIVPPRNEVMGSRGLYDRYRTGERPGRPISVNIPLRDAYRSKRDDLMPPMNLYTKLLLGREEEKRNPERLEGEGHQDYVRRLFSLTTDEEAQLTDELEVRRLELINSNFGNTELITRINREIEFQKWRFTGKPGDPLPQAVRYYRRRPTIDMSHGSGTNDIVNKYREKVSERTASYRLHRTMEDAQHQTRAYTFLESFQNPIESTTLEEHPLSNLAKLALEKQTRQKLAREHGIEEVELDMPKSASGVAAQQRYRKGLYALDAMTEQRSVPTKKESDPEARLRDFLRREIAAELVAINGVEVDLGSIKKPNVYSTLFAKNKVTGEPVMMSLPLERFIARYCDLYRDVPSVLSEFRGAIEGALTEEGQYAHPSLASRIAAFHGVSMTARDLYDGTDIGTLERLIWMRQPAFDDNELRQRDYEVYDAHKSPPTRDEYDKLRKEKIATIHNDNRSVTEKTRQQLVRFGKAFEVPEQAQGPVTFSLHFGKNSAGQHYFPDEYFPDALGFSVVAKRKTDTGTEFDFVSSGEDLYRPCNIVCASQSNLGVSDRLRVQGLSVIDSRVRAYERLTFTEFQNIFADNSIYFLPENTEHSPIIIENGVLMAQCAAANELFAQIGDGVVPNVTVRKIGGMVISPDEDYITRAGHAQTEVIDGSERYICDATPRLTPDQTLAHMSTSALMNLLASLGNLQTMPSFQQGNNNEPNAQQSPQPNKKAGLSLEKPKQPPTALIPKPEKEDPRILAQKEIEKNAAVMQTIKTQFENTLRVRLGIEDDITLRKPDALYKHLLKLVPNASDPLRMASRVVISAANNIINADMLEANQKQCAEVLEKIAYFKKQEAEKRQKVSKVADTNTLASLDASVRAVSMQYARMARAYAVLRTDDAAQQS